MHEPVPAAVGPARVLAIAGPVMLANATTPLLGVVATAVIGRLGEAHLLGGIALAAVVFDLLFWVFGFLRMGTVALTAQALGAGDAAEQNAVLSRALLLAAAIGLVVVALQQPLAAIVFALMGGSDAVTAAAGDYFAARVWSAPFVFASFAVMGWLVGLARTGWALALQIVVNAVNMAATVLFVFGLDLGVAGAGWAAVLAESLGFALGLAILRLRFGIVPALAAALRRRDAFMRMIVVNRDIMIRTFALIAAFFFFTAQGARSGDVVLAANAVLHTLTLVAAFVLDGFATAAEQLCGRAVGARSRAGFSRAVALVLWFSAAVAIATAAILAVAGSHFVSWMTASEEVRVAAADYLVYAALFPLAGAAAYAFDGIFIGATWTASMRNLMLLALAVFVAAWWLLLPLGNAGLWLAMLAFLAARGALQAMRYPHLRRATFS